MNNRPTLPQILAVFIAVTVTVVFCLSLNQMAVAPY
jgi:hypothetical protein